MGGAEPNGDIGFAAPEYPFAVNSLAGQTIRLPLRIRTVGNIAPRGFAPEIGKRQPQKSGQLPRKGGAFGFWSPPLLLDTPPPDFFCIALILS
jgi:hypothetical protein